MPISSLVSGGPLTTAFSAPAPCTSTTAYSTNFGSAIYHMGMDEYRNAIQICYPPLGPQTLTVPSSSVIWISPTSIPTPTPTNTISTESRPVSQTSEMMITVTTTLSLPSATGRIVYYSPGICPPAWTYAATFTDLKAASETRYMCCPTGYSAMSLGTTASRPLSAGVTKTHTYAYPTCISTGTDRPVVESATRTIDSGATKFTATASGFVVGWKEADVVIRAYLESNSVKLPPVPVETSTMRRDPFEERKEMLTSGEVAAAVIVPFILVAVGIFYIVQTKRLKARQALANLQTTDQAITIDPQADWVDVPPVSLSASDVEMGQRRQDPFDDPPPAYEESASSSRH